MIFILIVLSTWLHLTACLQLPLLFPSNDAHAPTTSESPLISLAVESYINSLLIKHSSPGLAIAVVLKDPSTETGFRHQLLGVGNAQTSTSPPIPVTPDTLFAIASNSKLFLALSTGLLISNASLGLDWTTPVASVIPEWQLADPIASQEATLLDLLVHRTGMPRHDFAGASLKGGVPAMISNLRHLRPSASFRSTFQYNNMMYETLSYLPRRLLNISYESYVAEHIFAPVGMNASTYSVEEAAKRTYPLGYKFPGFQERKSRIESNSPHWEVPVPVFAHGHQYSLRDFYAEERGELRPTVPYFQLPGEEHVWAGAGGVLTSVRDMVPWLSTLLNGEVVPHTNKTVIPPDVLARLETGVMVSEGKGSYPELSPKVYGPAQWRFTYRGHEIIEHGGNNPGFKTQVARLPNLAGKIPRFPNATGLGIAVFSNDAEGGVVLESVKWRIIDDLLQLKEIDWYSRYVQEVERYYTDKRRAALPRPVLPDPPPKAIETLQNYTFNHPAYGVLQPCYVPPSGSQVNASIPSYTWPEALSPRRKSQETSETSADRALACAAFLHHPTTRLLLSHQSTDLAVPTLVIPFRRTFATHLRLTHWSGPWFNVTVVWGNHDLQPEGHTEDGVLIGLDEKFEVEWVVGEEEEGLSFRGGIWGMEGPDAKAPVGKGKEGAEVWFKRV